MGRENITDMPKVVAMLRGDDIRRFQRETEISMIQDEYGLILIDAVPPASLTAEELDTFHYTKIAHTDLLMHNFRVDDVEMATVVATDRRQTNVLWSFKETADTVKPETLIFSQSSLHPSVDALGKEN